MHRESNLKISFSGMIEIHILRRVIDRDILKVRKVGFLSFLEIIKDCAAGHDTCYEGFDTEAFEVDSLELHDEKLFGILVVVYPIIQSGNFY